MQEWERNPDGGRPWVSAAAAASRLGYEDYRTAIKMIQKGTLAGGKFPNKNRWWAYSDAPPLAPDNIADIQAGIADLARSVGALNELVGELATRDVQRDALVDQLSREIAALRADQMANKDRVATLLAAQAESELANRELLSGAQRLAGVSETYRDILLQMHLPDHVDGDSRRHPQQP